jgi:hypothetical protein
MHVPVPEQPAPDQPANRDPPEADADSVTDVPSSNKSEQVAPQLIAPTLELTVPDPAPLFETDSAHTATNVAVTERAALIVTTQVEVPEQPAPDQPTKRDPAEAEAVSVTSVPSS